RIGLEQAGAEFERAAAPLVSEMNAIEQRQAHERALQYEKMPEPERPQRQKGLDYPRMR
ncbi:nuclease, partial [Salmonella enterica subsp. enterica serovar Agona]|nr:nuclease [Salmonella enterica subsp. enterica serovar Agona]